ncbi:MAG: sulfonate transport system permease protein [Thermotogota bacterium]|nr:sulfonate transport system permease protein [Thermotogota bacterium]MDK2864901.1 sulfonate transport system permease protein [Thermotogota bacterium]
MSSKVRFQRFSWLIVLAIVIVIWELLARYTRIPRVLFPSPQTTFVAFIEMSKGDLWNAVSLSLLRCLAGFSIGTSLGLAIGITMGLSGTFYNALSPLFNAIYAIPSVALIPVFMVWLGLTNSTIIASVSLASFINVVMTSATGIKNVPQTVIKTAKAMGAKGTRLVLSVYLPLSLRSIFTGMKLGIEHAWKTSIVAEMLIGIKGLGMSLTEAEGLLRVDILFATVVIIGAFGWLFERILAHVEKRLVKYAS